MSNLNHTQLHTQLVESVGSNAQKLHTRRPDAEPRFTTQPFSVFQASRDKTKFSASHLLDLFGLYSARGSYAATGFDEVKTMAFVSRRCASSRRRVSIQPSLQHAIPVWLMDLHSFLHGSYERRRCKLGRTWLGSLLTEDADLTARTLGVFSHFEVRRADISEETNLSVCRSSIERTGLHWVPYQSVVTVREFFRFSRVFPREVLVCCCRSI